jgi:holo-ACP synthase CitX
MSITLEQLLKSRDERVEHQKDLLGTHPGKSLLCLTVQLPGPEKRNRTSLAIAQAGVEAVREAFKPEYEELRDLETGYEAYFLVSLPAPETKRLACHIEDTHPLGRLMDIDVITPTVSYCHSERSEESVSQTAEGNYFSCSSPKNQFPSAIGAVSRADIGLEPRKCLLCGNEVRYCMRAKSHTTSELLVRIEEMVNCYGC